MTTFSSNSESVGQTAGGLRVWPTAVLAVVDAATAKTSVAQPTISAMSAWWTPAETFGKALVSKQVNDGNVKQKTADFMASVKKDVANKQ